jgi:hypothetical protein
MSGHPREAQDTLSHALTLSVVGEDALVGAELLFHFGSAISDLGDGGLAREVLSTALDAFVRIGARQWAERVQRRLTDGVSSQYF